MICKKDDRREFAQEGHFLEEEHQALWLLNNTVGLGWEGEYLSNPLLLFLHLEHFRLEMVEIPTVPTGFGEI